MTTLADAPSAVRHWISAERSPEAAGGRRDLLADTAVLEFGAHRVQGADPVLERIGLMIPPGWLGDAEWSLVSATGAEATVRATGPAGAPLPSPGGPMSAFDIRFVLDDDGRIALIAPQPHHPEPPGLAAAPEPGDVAPGLVLPSTDGTETVLDPAAATATVVVFTCNHCPWALGWHDRLQQVARDTAARGVRFLQVNANDPAVNPRDGLDVSRERVAAGEFAGPYLVDADQSVARSWGARNTPDVVVLDPAGVVAYHGAPDADATDPALDAAWLRAAIDAVLDGRTPDPARTPVVGCSINWSRP
ncbi:hypothetical protein GCM10009613_63800 [Pseudonocardia kongjuensis]|uniref:Thioredoxin domain-containing protein n=1 Tax=Pseudonocardia kongjuensis TaxID=102227 RepID=A0ABP4IZ87_9PSEU